MLVYDFDHYFYFTNILEINLIGYELFPLVFFFLAVLPTTWALAQNAVYY